MPVVLVGNPNVGKSVVFRALTGRYAEVSNFPGTTVGIRRAQAAGLAVWDAPGVYGLSRFSDEERVTVEAIRQADLIVNVVDARHLARDLFLTLQLKSLGLPMVVLLNRMDEVRAAGDFLDAPGLERALGVPVIKAAAVRGEGIPELLQTLRAGEVKPPPAPRFWEGLPPAVQGLSPVDRLLWWEEDQELLRRLQAAPPAGNREAEYVRRRQEADALATRFYRPGDAGYGRWQRHLDEVLLHPLWGWLVLVALLGAVYQLLGVEVANRLVGWLEALLGRTWVPWVRAALSPVLAPGSLGAELLTGRYGLLTMTVTYLVALLLPLITGFELMLAVLEDTGYLPRLATLLDRFFLRLGLNGRAVIPLILGFGCVTMATLTTRILEGRRERTIASVLLAWTIPCSAQVGVITGLLAGLGARWALAYAAIILSLFILVGTTLDRALPGRP
ncbi:MAG: ferrous iron transporter B, partial [Firmicutes bacterium]|nr:ferrous iron transporter B [Bacillota bacterium]